MEDPHANTGTPEGGPFVTRAEVCGLLKVHRATVRRWEIAGKLTPFAFTGGTVRYKARELEQLFREASTSTKRKPGPKPREAKPESAKA